MDLILQEDNSGWTAVMYSVLQNSLECLSQEDNSGWTAVMYSVLHNFLECLSLLLDTGAWGGTEMDGL